MARHFLGIALQAVSACALFVAVPAGAAKFAAYEGKDAIREGDGGTKIVKDGVDFWTTGAPPRRYKILGILEDKRGTGILSGHAVGDGGIAKKVKELGGNAVIVAGQDTKVVGYVTQGNANASGNNAYGYSTTAPVSKAYTTLVVVQYLDIAPTSAATPQSAPPSTDISQPQSEPK